MQFAFDYLEINKVTAFVRPGNTRSLIKNLKIGFHYVDDIVFEKGTRRRLEVSPKTAVRSDSLRVFDCRETGITRNP
ncbi:MULTISPECIES: hypothetical protein [Mesorhizobium]|uniref:hypothetical protein n=1 Tax=Mesorhizobium TaxID=68287 RepID=UPI00398C4A86